MRYLAAALAVMVLSAQAQTPSIEHSATVEGAVRDERGRPVAGATVHLQTGAGGQARSARTDSEGRYRFSVSEGRYTLRAEVSGSGEATSGPFAVARNEAKRVDLTLAPPFFDEPTFIVAGVSDPSSRGGHGSDTVLRSTEALAKATASLSKQPSADAASEKSLQEAIARDPGNAELYHRLADVEEKLGNALEAVHEYQRAAELERSESNLFDWGTELLTHRAADQAIEIFTRGNRLFPHSTRILLGLATAWYSRGAYEEAARRFFEACDLNPADPTPYLFLGKVQVAEITQLDGFVERLGRFATLQPDNALANYYYAASLWRRWKGPADSETPAQVRSLLEQALRLDSNLADAHMQLGILYADQKDFSNAIAEFRKAIAVNPRLEQAHYRLAQTYRRAGEELKAKKEFELHDQLAKKSAAEVERERSEIQEFVFSLRDR